MEISEDIKAIKLGCVEDKVIKEEAEFKEPKKNYWLAVSEWL